MQQTVDGETTTYTLDLAIGLTQVLAGNANTYLNVVGRIGEVTSANWAYHNHDALGSLRQLTDRDGTVTLTKSYLPYGDELSSSGVGASSYGFTGEMRDIATGLVYLRARYYAPWDGRFTQKDPSRLEQNLYLYASANPVNLYDPSGLLGIAEIAEAYGMSEHELEGNLRFGLYDNPELKGRWGWIKLLLDAETGQSVSAGSPALLPPYLDIVGPDVIVSDGCKNVWIGHKPLLEYTRDVLDSPMLPFLLWRDTKPHHYFLDGQEYLDADRPRDLPDFRTMSGDLLWLLGGPAGIIVSQIFDAGLSVTIDRYGEIYVSGYGGVAPSIGGQPISVGEGYISRRPEEIINQISNRGYIPSATQTHEAITGFCDVLGANLLTGLGQVALCGNGSTMVVYGYTFGLIGGHFEGSFGMDTGINIPSLAWDYIDKKSGIDIHEARWW